MKTHRRAGMLLGLVIAPLWAGEDAPPSDLSPLSLWYRAPATKWEEALPAAWPQGSVRGLRARGGFIVDLEWRDRQVTRYRIASPESRPVTIRLSGATREIRSEKL